MSIYMSTAKVGFMYILRIQHFKVIFAFVNINFFFFFVIENRKIHWKYKSKSMSERLLKMHHALIFLMKSLVKDKRKILTIRITGK